MTTLRDALLYLDRLGVYDILLPFILIFAVTYAIMTKAKILGKKDEDGKQKKYAMAIALVISLGSAFAHLSQRNYALDPINVINEAISSLGVWIVAGLALLLVIGMATGKNFKLGSETSFLNKIFAFAAILIVGYIFLNATNTNISIPFLSNSSVQSILIVVILFFVIVSFIVGPNEEKDPKKKQALKDKKAWGKFGKNIEAIMSGKQNKD